MNAPAPDRLLPALLLALTAVTGFVDAVSCVALGHVFTANITGNVVFIGFAMAAAPGLSIDRSGVALGAFLIGANHRRSARDTDRQRSAPSLGDNMSAQTPEK